MKFVVIIDKDGGFTTFRHDDPGPLPPVIHPQDESEPKDGEPREPEELPHKVGEKRNRRVNDS